MRTNAARDVKAVAESPTTSVHMEIYCLISPTGSFHRTRGMNHVPIAPALGLRVGSVNIVPQLRHVGNARFADGRVTQRANRAIPHAAQTREEGDQGVCCLVP